MDTQINVKLNRKQFYRYFNLFLFFLTNKKNILLSKMTEMGLTIL